MESNGYKAITFYLALKPASDSRMCTTKDTKFTKERTEGKKAVVMEAFLPFVNFVFFVVQPLPQLVTPLAMLYWSELAWESTEVKLMIGVLSGLSRSGSQLVSYQTQDHSCLLPAFAVRSGSRRNGRRMQGGVISIGIVVA